MAQADPKTLTETLDQLADDELESLLYDWSFLARPDQVSPPGDWFAWLMLAGRGAGKTRAGAEWIREQVKRGAGRIALVAPTAADARDVMVEGESGLLSVCWERDHDRKGKPMGRPEYEPSRRRVVWQNGAVAFLYSAMEPERLRGPQHEVAWLDELAAWRHLQQTWDMLILGLRLGEDPRLVATTTPKPRPLIRSLINDPTVVVTRAATFDNPHLAETAQRQFRSRYQGTSLGRQELYGELLAESEGALWSMAMIDACRGVMPPLDRLRRIAVSIDPAASHDEGSDETGITVQALGDDGRGYVLADLTGRYPPEKWGRVAVEAYWGWGADILVAEANQGGEMVRSVLRTIDRRPKVKLVRASRGKQTRAEPVASLYQQGRVVHAGEFPALEDQMVTWEPYGSEPSPDRLDAMVWGFTELMLDPRMTVGWGAYRGAH